MTHNVSRLTRSCGLWKDFFPLLRTKLRKKHVHLQKSEQLCVADVIVVGETLRLADKTIFSNIPFQLAYIFELFYSNFFKFTSLKFKKKNRPPRDIRLAFKLAREQVSLLFISKHFHAQLLFIPTFIFQFFIGILFKFIYSNF